jgi:hypothetical protein
VKVHVINEAASPYGAIIWTMWCGAACIALDDSLVPEDFDFYPETAADKSDCPACRAALGLNATPRLAEVTV